ncbi:DUF6199 family natural product biosynthesis protein [Nocardiopsis nanhaiensis]
MELLYLIFGIGILWFACVLIQPRVVWYVSAWQYRNPEKNEPSEAYFTMHRLGAIVAIVVLLGSCSVLANADSSGSASGGSASDDSSESASAPETDAPESSPSPDYTGPDGLTSVTTSSDHAQIRGYVIEEDDEGNTGEESTQLAVSLAHIECVTTIGDTSARVQDEDRVEISSMLGAGEAFCGSERDGLQREAVTLSEPLGDREVVDTDGAVIRHCGTSCGS